MTDGEAPRIRRNAVYALAAEGSRAVLAATLVVLLSRTLDPDGYGIYALAISIAGLLILASDFGVSPAAARYMAEHRGDRGAMAGVTADALRLKLVLAGVVSLALALGADVVADAYGEPALAGPLRATAIALLAQSLFSLFVALVVAMGRTSLQALLFAGESVAEVVLVGGIVLAGGGAAAAAWGRAGAFTIGALLGLALLARALGGGMRPRRRFVGPGRSLAGYAGALFIVDAGYALYSSMDLLLVGAYEGSTGAGEFEAALRLTVMISLAGSAAASAVAPRVAKHGTEPQAVGALEGAIRVLTHIGLAAACVLLVWADPIVGLLFGDDYEGSIEVLRGLTPFVLLGILGPLITMSVNYLGLGRSRIPIVLAALVIDIVVAVILIPRLGPLGGAIATSVAYGVYLPAHLVFLHRELPLDLRRLGLTLLRGVLAAGALAAVLAFVAGTGEVGVVEMLGVGVLGLAAYVATLAATMEIRPRDLRALSSALRGG